MHIFKWLLLTSALLVLSVTASAQLVVNEVSQGPTGGVAEYVELLVVGNPTCDSQYVDLRGWIIDDNNGWHKPGSGSGIASGCMRFPFINNWARVKMGSIILIYNNASKNTNITAADDISDANNDCIYIVPANSDSLERSIGLPSTSMPSYSGLAFTTGGAWSTIAMRNGGDAAHTVDPNDLTQPFHSVCWGDNTLLADIAYVGSASGDVFIMENTISNDYSLQTNWNDTTVSTAGTETPGSVNNMANATWISSMNFNCSEVFQIINIDTTICQGQLLNSVVYTNDTAFSDTIVNPFGCDTITTANIIVISPTDVNIDTTVCLGGAYNGIVYNNDTILRDTVSSTNGCDSIRTIANITIISPTDISVDTTICIGDLYDGNLYNNDTILRDTAFSTTGCDSIRTTVTISVVPVSINSVDTTICLGNTYDGIAYTNDTIISDTLRNVDGCDSIRNSLSIRVISPLNLNTDTILCFGDLFLGIILNNDTTITDTFLSIGGCDSIWANLNVRVIPVSVTTVDTIICQGDLYGGIAYSNDTSINDTTLNINGCDSIRTAINITVVSPTNVLIDTTICLGDAYDGVSFTSDTSYNDTLRNSSGCDSILTTTNIQVITPIDNSIDTILCSGSAYNSLLFTNDTILFDTLFSQSGCDSIRTVANITIISPTDISIDTTICSGDIYDGMAYVANTVLRDTVRSQTGCDSIRTTVNITVISAANNTLNPTICSGDFYNGVQYFANTTLRDTIRSTQGCDSTRTTINIMVVSPSAINLDTFICSGDMYNGVVYTSNSVIQDTLTSTTGCDSLYRNIRIFVNPLPVLTFSNDTVVCRGRPVNIWASGGTMFNWSNGSTDSLLLLSPTLDETYQVTVTDINGCSSVSSPIQVFVKDLTVDARAEDYTLNLGQSTRVWVADSSANNTYQWTPDETLVDADEPTTMAEPKVTTTYTVFVRDSLGCTASDTLTIFINRVDFSILLPTAFTPNGDGLNDVIRILNPNDIELNRFSIYNRWGELVFETNSVIDGWDGTFKGQNQPVSTFAYYIEAVDVLTGERISQAGNFTLLR